MQHELEIEGILKTSTMGLQEIDHPTTSRTNSYLVTNTPTVEEKYLPTNH